MPPKSVGGKEISFYGTFISPKWAKYYHNKKVLVHFADNGTYYAKEGGRTLDRGEYSYVPRKGTHSATLMRSYTTKKGQIHIYELRLDFNDTASGTWEMLHSSDPDVTVVEKGTFILIN
jgi:hypothetical protein